MAHMPACTLQQAVRIPQPCALKKTHVHMRAEYIDVAEGRVSQTGHWAPVMHQFPDLVPALPHLLEPFPGYGAEFAGPLIQPQVNGGIALYSAVKSK